MAELMREYWVLFVIALLIGIAIAWWIFVASRRVRVETSKRDTLDEGAERATRNQALIDAPPAAAAGFSEIPPATPAGMAGAGEAIAHAAEPVHQQPRTEPEPEAPAVPEEPPRETNGAPQPDAPSETERPNAITPSEEVRDAGTSGAATDDLRQIKGIGPKLEQTLHALGVTTLAQIAAWDNAEIDRIDAQLGKFQGRIRRDQWVEQARLLAEGDQAGYESRFGRV